MSGDGDVLGLNRRRAILAVAGAVLLTVGAVAVLGQVTSYGTLVDAARQARTAWLPLCLTGEVVAYLGYVVAYRSVAAVDGGPKLALGPTAQVVSLGLGAYVVGSGVGGLAVDYWALRRASTPREYAVRRTLALNTLDAAALTALAALSGAVVLARGRESGVAVVVAAVWTAVVPAAVAAAAYVSQPQRARRLIVDRPEVGRLRLRAPRTWPRWAWRQARRAFSESIAGVVVVRHVLTHPLRYAGGIVGFPLFWIGDAAILWFALAAFGTHLDPPRLLLAEATAWVLSFVPLPAGGSGFAEASMAGMLHVVGVPLSVALFAAVVYRAVNFWLPVIPALALLPRAQRLRGELEETRHGRPELDAELHVVGPAAEE